MPTYEYRCTDCGRTFERYQSFSEDPITVCPLPSDDSAPSDSGPNDSGPNSSAPACGGEVRKVFSNVGISFKGSGFYRNDSRSESRSKSKTSGDSSSDAVSTSTSSASNDSGTKESAKPKDSKSSSVEAASASG